MEKKGIASSLGGKIVLVIILAVLLGSSAFIGYTSAGQFLEERRQERKQEEEMKKATGDIQWTNMKLLDLSRKEDIRFRTSFRKYLNNNLYGDVLIISIKEDSVERKDGILTFQIDVTTYGSFISSYLCELNDGEFIYTYYRNSYTYDKEARKEGEKDYGVAD